MASLLLLLSGRRRDATVRLRRRAVAVPIEASTTDAVFLVLRRMRLPLAMLVAIFTISVAGLTAIPGVDADGNPAHLTLFDAFYFMSYTATTIGFGEIPYAFTIPQRMWVTFSIYASVIGWAYVFGMLFALLQEQSFQDALATGAFRRRVRAFREPFLLVAGYGRAGRMLCRELDALGRRMVVLDSNPRRIETLAADQLASEIPGIAGDVHNPAVLGLAGLGHAQCEGVVALTSDDDANLAVVIATQLLRPDLPVIARANTRAAATRMVDFNPTAVINPYDRYGTYLMLALHQPVTYQLVSWLISPPGSELPPLREGLTDGRWVVCANGVFGEEVAADLTAAGLEVVLTNPADGNPDLTGVVGFIAGADNDTVNLALAAHARLTSPDVFLTVRQHHHSNGPLVEAFEPDAVFVPNDLVVLETLARIITPLYWSFIDHVLQQDDSWSRDLLARIVDRCGERTPHSTRIILDKTGAPAAWRWLQGGTLRLEDLTRDPTDRDSFLPVVPLVLIHDGETVYAPAPETILAPGDTIVVAARSAAIPILTMTLYYDSRVRYVATGDQVPETWVWRTLALPGH